MSTTELKIAQIGNSRGVRLPARVLRRYRIGGVVMMEEKSDGIFLRPCGPATEKLSWEDTARAMAEGGEDWTAWDAVSSDGMDAVAWAPEKRARVAESRAQYRAGRGTGRSK